jgi:hypothetical protein
LKWIQNPCLKIFFCVMTGYGYALQRCGSGSKDPSILNYRSGSSSGFLLYIKD